MKVILFAAPRVIKVIDITGADALPGASQKLAHIFNYVKSKHEGCQMKLVNYTNRSLLGAGNDVTSEYNDLLGDPFWDHVFAYRGILVYDGPDIIYYDISKITENPQVKYIYSRTRKSAMEIEIIQFLDGDPEPKIVKVSPLVK